MNSDKKISLVEAFLLVSVALVFDVIEIISDLISPIPIIGQLVLLISPFVDIIALFIIQLWLTIKSARWAWSLAGNLVEFIPYIDIFPIRTITLIITIYLTNKMANVPGIEQISKKITR